MFDFIERHGGGTVFKWGYCILAALLITIVSMHTTLAMRYHYGDETLTLTSVRDDTVVMTDSSGREAVLSGSPNLMSIDGTSTLTYLDRTIRCRVNWDDDMAYIYTFSDGKSYSEPFFSVDYGDGNYQTLRDLLKPQQREEYDLLNRMDGYLNDGSPVGWGVGLGVLAMLLLLLGMALLCFPETFWKLQTMFIVSGGEPTDWALFSNRAGGLLLITFAFVIPFLPR